jgi:methylated-DNA-protein-cysteine methyltransferase related protein
MDTPNLSPDQQKVFYEAVWAVVRQVPVGKVATYGQVGERVEKPQGVTDEDWRAYRARWVGQAMAACPNDVPWQRIINSEGKISPRPGADLQRTLLEQEGIEFDGRARIDLKRFGWNNLQETLF